MNKKLRTLCYSLMIIIGMGITQNVSAKVCVYEHTSAGYSQSGYYNMQDYKKVKVSYNDSTICYYINEIVGTCFAKGETTFDNGTYKFIDNITINNWRDDSDGCIDNLYVASGNENNKTIYAFTNSADSVELDGLIVPATAAKFISSSDLLTVTFKLPDGQTQTQEVEFGKTATSIDVALVSDGEVFTCWRIKDESECFNFATPLYTNIVLEAETQTQGSSAGFLGIDNKEVTCNGVNIPYGLPYMISRIIKLIKIMVPIILIVLGMIDYAKAVISNDEKNMKAASSKFIRRAMAAVIIYFVVAIIQFGFGLLGETGNELFECFDCFTTGDCDIKLKPTK